MTESGRDTEIYDRTLAIVATRSEAGEPVTTREVADGLECGRRMAYERLATLAEDGLLRTKKVGGGGRIWWQPPEPSGPESGVGPAGDDRLQRGMDTDDTDNDGNTRSAAASLAMLDEMPIALFVLDASWNFVYLNGAAETEFDVELQNGVGECIWEIFPEAIGTKFHEEYRDAILTGEPRTIESHFEPWDRWYREYIVPVDRCLAVAFRDITERVTEQEALKTARSQLENALAAGAVGTWDWHIQSDTFVAGPELARTFGVDPADAQSGVGIDRFLDAIHPVDRPRIRESIVETIETCGTYEEEYRVFDAEDSCRWVLARGEVLRNDAGEPAHFPGTLIDITARKRTERELERHKAFLERSNDVVAVLDRTGRIDYVSPSVERVLGYSPLQLQGENGFSLVHPADRPNLWASFSKLVDGPEPSVKHEVRLRTADDGWRWLELHARNHLDDPLIAGVIINTRDITDRKHRKWRLQRQNTELTQVNQLYELLQDLVQAVVSESDRREIEETVCRRLAAAEFYRGAWIGTVATASGAITPHAVSGLDADRLDRLLTDPDGVPALERLIVRTVREQSVHVSYLPARTDSGGSDGGITAESDTPAIAVPLGTAEQSFGVLVLHLDRSLPVDEIHRSILSDLGQTIGFAMAAARRKDALMAESVVSVTLSIEGADEFFTGFAATLDSPVRLEGMTRNDADSHLLYVTIPEAPRAAISRAADCDGPVEAMQIIDSDATNTLCAVRLTDPFILSTLADYGGRVTELSVRDGEMTVTVDFPRSTDIAESIDALTRRGATVSMTRKQIRSRAIDTERQFEAAVADRLTEKQQLVLETAFHAGYFENPRLSTGEEIAGQLGLSPSTFHQHVRVALHKLVDSVVDTP